MVGAKAVQVSQRICPTGDLRPRQSHLISRTTAHDHKLPNLLSLTKHHHVVGQQDTGSIQAVGSIVGRQWANDQQQHQQGRDSRCRLD
jgi:hypothetical protein